MASAIFVPSKALLEALSPARSRSACQCTKVNRSSRRSFLPPQRNVSTATAQGSEMDVNNVEKPRWSQTPSAMAAPYPTKSRPPTWQPYQCNSDPRRLDEAYVKFLGANGPELLSEETKWLAVTHKSFDHGRRGFNDRLAFLGKRIVELQASLGLLSSSYVPSFVKGMQLDPHGREPFEHPATANIEVLNGNVRSFLTNHKRIARLAEEYSIPDVVRWQPKNPDNLTGSGCDMVYAQTVFAVIGALALEQGGAVANKIARERIIQPLDTQRGISGGS